MKKKRIVVVIFDSIKQYIGFCDYGNAVSLENNDVETKEAFLLVFLLVSLKGAWKCPIAYFLINKTSERDCIFIVY